MSLYLNGKVQIQYVSDHFAQASGTCIESVSSHSCAKNTLQTTEVTKQMFKIKSSRKKDAR